jgi:hypothetical protein
MRKGRIGRFRNRPPDVAFERCAESAPANRVVAAAARLPALQPSLEAASRPLALRYLGTSVPT